MHTEGATFFAVVRAQAVPKAVNNVYPADMSPTRLSNTDSCGSCPWRMVFVVTKRLCQSLALDLGSSVFIMAPQHHMEVHKERMVVLFCDTGFGIYCSSMFWITKLSWTCFCRLSGRL